MEIAESDRDLVVPRALPTLGDYRRMNLWFATHARKTRLAIALLVLAIVGPFVAAVALAGSRWDGISNASYDIFVGALLALAVLTINVLVLAPRRARRNASNHAGYTYTFTRDGIAYAGGHSSGVLQWNAFAGFVARRDAIYVVMNGHSGALLFPRRLLTPDVAERLEAIVGSHLCVLTRV